jgi:hypothetical protein
MWKGKNMYRILFQLNMCLARKHYQNYMKRNLGDLMFVDW